MADKIHRAHLWIIAGLAILLGCALTATTLPRLSACRSHMELRMAEYRTLGEFGDKLRHMETAAATWQERQPGPPAPVSVLATNIFADAKVEIRELTSSNVAPGLIVRRIEVACQDVPFDRAMQLVQRLDGLWPRWVLVHLEVKSTDQAGRGAAVMRFETISSATAAQPVLQSQAPAPPDAVLPEKATEPAKAVEQSNPTGNMPRADATQPDQPKPRVWSRP